MSDNPNPTPTDGAAGAAPQRQVLLQKIYCKDASLEVPLAPQVFTRQWQPQVDVQVNTDIKPLEIGTSGLMSVLTCVLFRSRSTPTSSRWMATTSTSCSR